MARRRSEETYFAAGSVPLPFLPYFLLPSYLEYFDPLIILAGRPSRSDMSGRLVLRSWDRAQLFAFDPARVSLTRLTNSSVRVEDLEIVGVVKFSVARYPIIVYREGEELVSSAEDPSMGFGG